MRIKLKKMKVKYQVTPIDGEGLRTSQDKYKRGMSDHRRLARMIASDMCGLSMYEKKAIDLIKMKRDRKCKRFLKKRLGSLKRTIKKFEDMRKLASE